MIWRECSNCFITEFHVEIFNRVMIGVPLNTSPSPKSSNSQRSQFVIISNTQYQYFFYLSASQVKYCNSDILSGVSDFNVYTTHLHTAVMFAKRVHNPNKVGTILTKSSMAPLPVAKTKVSLRIMEGQCQTNMQK